MEDQASTLSIPRLLLFAATAQSILFPDTDDQFLLIKSYSKRVIVFFEKPVRSFMGEKGFFISK